MNILLDPNSLADYRRYLAIKKLPIYRFQGRTAIFPDEYAARLGLAPPAEQHDEYKPWPGLFDYQADITRTAIRKKAYACFVDCGLGKTLIELEFARHFRQHNPTSKGLIVTPLMVIDQFCAEAERFYGTGNKPTILKASELAEWLADPDGSGVKITNWDAIREGLKPVNLGCMILDECFPPDTPIDVLDCGHWKRRKLIKDIVCGETIINAHGLDTVKSVHRREVQYAVAVTAGKRIVSSPNHPYFTQRGWICAQDLRPGDSISQTGAAMRAVRHDVYPEGAWARAGAVLRSILLSEMADDATYSRSEGSQSPHVCEDFPREGSMVETGYADDEETAAQNHSVKPDNRSGGAGKDLPPVASHEPQTFRAWGKWDWFDTAAEDFGDCSWRELAGGVFCFAGSADSRLSHELQNRLSESRQENRDRGGWQLPFQQAGEGSKENSNAGFARVDCVAFLEPGHPELERYRDANGRIYFYDIEATRHPSYSVKGLLVHNSSYLKSHYGAWGTRIIELGKGVPYKLACTGTPAPNDRIEYANHAVFLDQFPTVNSFLAKFFINRGQTDNRWELKQHALEAFYRHLSHWSIFLTRPSVYGWKDNAGELPPINVHIHHVNLTDEQRDKVQDETGCLFAAHVGGITTRSRLSSISKGFSRGEKIDTRKPEYIRQLVASWPDESTIIWCLYNAEQDALAAMMPDAASIDGSTPHAERMQIIVDFKAGRKKTLISKSKILGFGLNLEICTRMIFSGLQDSYESYYQSVKRANRYGAKKTLHVHVPLTELEQPMVDNVLRKAHRVDLDAREQEQIFRQSIGSLTHVA